MPGVLGLCCKKLVFVVSCYGKKLQSLFREGDNDVPSALRQKTTIQVKVKDPTTVKYVSLHSRERAFRYQVRLEMVKMGATQEELKLIHDSMIRSALQNKRTPRDVAWAIMQ